MWYDRSSDGERAGIDERKVYCAMRIFDRFTLAITPTILYNGFNSLYGDKEDILEDHDICLTMALVSNFFEKFKQYRGERHPMVYSNDLDQFLSMIDLDMVKDGIVEEDEEPQYYLDMMDEYFGSDIGKNNNMDCDYHIWLFFTERTQNILYNRVKQKRNE